MSVTIIGMRFRPNIELVDEFDWTILKNQGGVVVSEIPARLVPEPTNPYDPNAIACFIGEFLLGYVPKTAKMRLSEEVVGKVTRIHLPQTESPTNDKYTFEPRY